MMKMMIPTMKTMNPFLIYLIVILKVDEKQEKGNVVQYIGAIDDSSRSPEKVSKRYVEDAVDALLSGQKPKVNTTKAIGCSIKTL